MSEKKSVFVRTKVVLLDWQKTQRLGWKIYSVNVMKFLTNYCGPHDYIKLTNSFRLFLLRSLPLVSRKKLRKEHVPPAVSA